MNRREFLKSGLAGLFGALLTWGGAVKTEEPEPDTIHVKFTESETAYKYKWEPGRAAWAQPGAFNYGYGWGRDPFEKQERQREPDGPMPIPSSKWPPRAQWREEDEPFQSI